MRRKESEGNIDGLLKRSNETTISLFGNSPEPSPLSTLKLPGKWKRLAVTVEIFVLAK